MNVVEQPLSVQDRFTTEQKRQFFLDNAEHDFFSLGKQYGLDYETTSKNTIVTRASRLFTHIQKNADKYGLAPDEVQRVLNVRNFRMGRSLPDTTGTNGNHGMPVTTEETQKLTDLTSEFKTRVQSARNKALNLLHKKLDVLAEDDNIDTVRIVELTTAFGTIFDKTALIMGEATENVAVLAKIDKNMSPEDALKAVLDMREANQAEKEKAKNKV